MKICFRCGRDKPRSDFYAHKRMADGLLGKCKTCTKVDVAKHREANIDKIREYDRVRGSEPQRRANTKRVNAEYFKRDPRRRKCRDAVRKAKASGDLKSKPCERCGSLRAVAHHESYDKPLVVRWFCQLHHKERHKQMKLEGITP